MMKNLKIKVHKTPIEDVLIIEPKIFNDERGSFYESFNQAEFNTATGLDCLFVQDNQSLSKKGILRGLHYQTQHVQGKLVRVAIGSVFDVCVDLRRASPTYGKWFGQELSSKNHLQIWIPPGLAHGFLVLSDQTQFLYKTTNYYDPHSDSCLLWNDPKVGIEWPLNRISIDPQLNMKDSVGLLWNQAQKF